MKKDTLVITLTILLHALIIVIHQEVAHDREVARLCGNCDLLEALDEYQNWSKTGPPSLALAALNRWKEKNSSHPLAGRVTAALNRLADKSPDAYLRNGDGGKLLQAIAESIR